MLHTSYTPDWVVQNFCPIQRRAVGQINRSRILFAETGAVLVFLPPLPEQRAIAAVLSDVDELIGSLEALIAKKRAIKQAAMQELLTGRTRLPGFGGEWDVRRLRNLGTFSKGRGIKRTDLRKTGMGCVRYGELYTRYENYVSKPVSKVPQDIADTALPIRRSDHHVCRIRRDGRRNRDLRGLCG